MRYCWNCGEPKAKPTRIKCEYRPLTREKASNIDKYYKYNNETKTKIGSVMKDLCNWCGDHFKKVGVVSHKRSKKNDMSRM